MTTKQAKFKEQLAFQEQLDARFPIGGLCATLVDDRGRLRPTGIELVTGRLVCSDAERDRAGKWWHQLVIDPRHDVEEQVTPLVVWVDALKRHAFAPELWEAQIRGHDTDERLRIHAQPDRPWRPTRAMRRAVTEAHPDEIPVSPSAQRPS